MTRTAFLLALSAACFSTLASASLAQPLQASLQDRPLIATEPEAFLGRFLFAVSRCWNHDPGSEAADVTVGVAFSLNRDGRVQGNEVQLISSDGDQSTTNMAFEAARRAILRCQQGGYQLPADKYDKWKDVVITFDPTNKRLR